MKLARAVVCVLVFTLGVVSLAEAKGRNGGSAFRGGFSSQRQKAPSYQAPAPSKSQGASFGGFGRKKSIDEQKTDNVAPSQMSRDLSANAAQTNALKTADARNNRNNTANNSTGNGSGNGWYGGSDKNGTPRQDYQAQPRNYQTHNSYQTIVHRDSGGFMHGLMWFMIGRSMASERPVYVPVNNATNNGQWDAQTQTAASENAITPAPAQEAAAPESESGFLKVLRLVLWALLITGVIWMVRKIMRLRKRFAKPNYSLGS